MRFDPESEIRDPENTYSGILSRDQKSSESRYRIRKTAIFDHLWCEYVPDLFLISYKRDLVKNNQRIYTFTLFDGI